MQLNIKKCLEERTRYPILKNGDSLLDSILDMKDACYIIIPDHILWDEVFQLFYETHYVTGIFFMGKVMQQPTHEFTLITTAKVNSDIIMVGEFDGLPHRDFAKHLSAILDPLTIPSAYSVEFNKYTTSIENWINNSVSPKDTDYYSFNLIDRSTIEPKIYNAFYYSKKAIKCREIIKNELTVKLMEVADVLDSEELETNEKYSWIVRREYPFSWDNTMELRKKATVSLHKGDILIPYRHFQDKVYMLDVEPERPLYVYPYFHYIVRCKRILPEYLYLYLNSSVAKCMITYAESSHLKPLEKKDLEGFPIIVPRIEDSFYKNDFKILTSSSREYGDYELKEAKARYYENIHNADYPYNEASSLEELLSIELAQKVRIRNRETLTPFLSEDINELNTCFINGAYKATLILAGSIMEALLIDWLSEINHKNYFEEDYLVNKGGQLKRGDLIDYINAIKDIKKPEWMEEADHAHIIRKKRNLVHAKLCLKENANIDENICREVVNYLEQIIRSRGLT